MTDWYRLDSKLAFEHLDSSTNGVTDTEVRRRLEKYGYNRLSEKEQTSAVVRFLLQFHNVLIYVLLAAVVVTASMGEWVDAGVIFGVVIINAIIGFVQESKAEQALASLKKMLSQTATVIRAGVQMEVAVETLVPGDVVLLASGDRAPADLRLFEARNLHVDEAALTGESLPVNKNTNTINKEVLIGDRLNMIFSGTFVTSGRARGVVIRTGDQTELGRIAGMLQAVEETHTPLTRRLARFAKSLTIFIIVGCILVYAFGTVVRELPSLDMFMAAVAIAISAIPEGLPAIMTITLAIGVTRMAGRHAIIRKLPAVETLGSTRIICTDKTGTLTRNEMTVTRIITQAGVYSVSGAGYTPTGAFFINDQQVDANADKALMDLLRTGLLCNEAKLEHDPEGWQIIGDPTEAALLVAARKAMLVQDETLRTMPRTDAIPFESEQKLMATLHHDHHGNVVIHLKGAPERIIDLCLHNDDAAKQFWIDQAYTMAGEGLRVLAMAHKPVSSDTQTLDFADIDAGGFCLLGLTGMRDPLRQEAKEAVLECRDAGIQVKMITGDHALTAGFIANDLGLGDKVMTGIELDRLDDVAFAEVARDINVFARVSPAHKLRLVQALQKDGEVVAMTGDGVNDAPALKQADIGIAMGVTGTEVSKEAADMVITDDNFASIESAVEEGRTVFTNLIKTILFILPTNGGECLVIIWSIITASMLPVLPLHILWINMVTTVALAITLAFEPVEKGTMRQPPRDPQRPIIEAFMMWRIALVSVVMAAGTFGLFYFEQSNGSTLNEARTVAVNTIVFFEIFYVFNTRYLRNSVLSMRGLLDNRIILIGAAVVVVLQLIFTYWSVFNGWFRTAPIDATAWLRVLLVSSSIFFIVELEKIIQRYAARPTSA